MLPGNSDSLIDSFLLLVELVDVIEPPRLNSNSDPMLEVDSALKYDVLVGVAGGVMTPLSSGILVSFVPMVFARILVGESGGVDTILRGSGLENLLDGISTAPGIVGVWRCNLEAEISDCWGAVKREYESIVGAKGI